MKCVSCQHEIQAGVAFCGNCGAPVAMAPAMPMAPPSNAVPQTPVLQGSPAPTSVQPIQPGYNAMPNQPVASTGASLYSEAPATPVGYGSQPANTVASPAVNAPIDPASPQPQPQPQPMQPMPTSVPMSAPVYGAPAQPFQGMPNNAPYQANNKDDDALANKSTWALVLSVLAVPASPIPILGFTLAGFGIYMGRKSRTSRRGGMSTASLIVGIIAILASILVMFANLQAITKEANLEGGDGISSSLFRL